MKTLTLLKPGFAVYNLGTGVGYTVLEVLEAYGKVVDKEIPRVIKERRPGDTETNICRVTKAV